MSVGRKLRRSLVRMAYPAMASYYRSWGTGGCPTAVLEFLGIADSSYRTSFYTLCRLVQQTAPKGGLFAECGVYRGAKLLGMANKLKMLGVAGYHLIGFDSFEGFPEPAKEDALPDGSHHARALKGVFSDTKYEELSWKIRLLGFGRDITLVKGYFEETLSAMRDKHFTLVHPDCDLYNSYMTCLEFFYPRVERGGCIVFDEYDFSATVYPGAKKAIDAFLVGKPEKIQWFSESVNPRGFIVKQ